MQGAGDVRNVSSENIYAICDVDENFLNKAAEAYPSAGKYRDFRRMLDKADGILAHLCLSCFTGAGPGNRPARRVSST